MKKNMSNYIFLVIALYDLYKGFSNGFNLFILVNILGCIFMTVYYVKNTVLFLFLGTALFCLYDIRHLLFNYLNSLITYLQAPSPITYIEGNIQFALDFAFAAYWAYLAIKAFCFMKSIKQTEQ